jgi:hypothetical protein
VTLERDAIDNLIVSQDKMMEGVPEREAAVVNSGRRRQAEVASAAGKIGLAKTRAKITSSPMQRILGALYWPRPSGKGAVTRIPFFNN